MLYEPYTSGRWDEAELSGFRFMREMKRSRGVRDILADFPKPTACFEEPKGSIRYRQRLDTSSKDPSIDIDINIDHFHLLTFSTSMPLLINQFIHPGGRIYRCALR